MIRTVFFLAIVAFIPDGCAPVNEQHEMPDRSVPEYEGQSWHERYVSDACERCPDCCVAITEHGFIDSYGVERPADWLPEIDVVDEENYEDCGLAVSEDEE